MPKNSNTDVLAVKTRLSSVRADSFKVASPVVSQSLPLSLSGQEPAERVPDGDANLHPDARLACADDRRRRNSILSCSLRNTHFMQQGLSSDLNRGDLPPERGLP